VPLETVPDGAAFDDCLVGQELISLRHVTAVLREQCPWDREQRAMDIVSYTIEEVYELTEAIMQGRLDDEHDELGDVLFQVYFSPACSKRSRPATWAASPPRSKRS